jgi:hypothetical protein
MGSGVLGDQRVGGVRRGDCRQRAERSQADGGFDRRTPGTMKNHSCELLSCIRLSGSARQTGSLARTGSGY